MDTTDTGEMIVKRVSVPIGLEELMEGLVKEVLLKKPDDIYFFAAKYFSQLLLRRDNGQTKVKTIRSAQSLTDQREKRFQTKIPVSGVTKQLSRQFSIRGESPMRNFDSPIISQKPKMYDRSESKYKRRNTGPPTIPENHINIEVRKKYSRSVSTERKREMEHSASSTKRSINRKEAKDMQDETNEKAVRKKNGDKRNSVTKEFQKNISLMKNIPTSQGVRKLSEEKNISEKDETVGDLKSVIETTDLNDSVQSNNEIQVLNKDIQASTELLVQDDLGMLPEKTAAPIENSSVENLKRELEDGNNILRKNGVEVAGGIKNDGSADGSVNKNNDGIEGIMNRNEDDEKPQSMEHPSDVNVENTGEVLKVNPNMETSSEKSQSPSDTLDNLTMETENAQESRSVSVNSHENDKDATKNSGITNSSKLAYEDLNTVKEDTKATEEKNGQHEPDVTINGSDKTEEILGHDKKAIDTEIPREETSVNNDNESIPLLINKNGERSGDLKTGSESEQLLLENIPTAITRNHGADNDLEPEHEISNENNSDSSHRKEVNESDIKTEQRSDSDNQKIGEQNHRESITEEKVDGDIDRLVTEKENINKARDSDERGINGIPGKGADNSLTENEIIEMISNDEVDTKNGTEESHNDAILNKKSRSTGSSKDESIELLETPLKQPPMEHEGVVKENETSEIKICKNSSDEINNVENKEQEPNDQQLTGEQSNIDGALEEITEHEGVVMENETSEIKTGENSSNENKVEQEPNDKQLTKEQSNIDGALKETTNSLSDKEHVEIIADTSLENISSGKEPSEIIHNGIDQAENDCVSKNGLTTELSEENTKNNEENDIPDTNSTADKESLRNAGNESISRNESSGNEEIIEKDSSKTRETFDSLKAPYISDNQSYKNSNDKSIVPESTDNLAVEQTRSETVKIITNIRENSELENDDTKEKNVESSHKTEKLPINISDDTETNEKGKTDEQKLKEHQDEHSEGSTELKNIDVETAGQSEIDRNHHLYDSNVDILFQKVNNEEGNSKIDTTERKELFVHSSEMNEMDEIDEKLLTQNLKEKQEELSKNLQNVCSEKSELNETKTAHSKSIRNGINPSEVKENIATHKEMVELNNSNSVAYRENEKLDEEKSVSKNDRKAIEKNGCSSANITEKMGATALPKTIDENEDSSAIDGSSGPERNSKIKNSILEQGIDSNEDVASILNGPNQSKRNKRSLEQENEFSKNSQDFDTESNFKSKHESSTNTKEIEESNTETNSRDLILNHEISQPVDKINSKEVSDSNAGDEKHEDIDTSENKTNVGIIDKVAKNYISYVIDKENYIKYNHADNDRNEDDTLNITNGISNDMPENAPKQQNEFDENSDIQKNHTDNQTSFDRSKLREELGILSMKEPNNSEKEELKRNISSTLSIAETGLIDTQVKTFINNFISTEKANNEEHKITQSTDVGSEDIVDDENNEKDINPNGFQTNESFDRSKLREELQKIEQESKFTSFKQSFNSSLLRQELEHAAIWKKSTENNVYSSTLAKAAAVVRIQSMWRGFIVRKSFPKPQYNDEFSVHRDENSNVYQEKKQAIESKLSTRSIVEKENNEDPKLMEAVSIIQRCWRGFKVRKHLNSIRMTQNSLESARIKRHVDGKNIDFFDTMRAAVKIQKIWRGFITRKKLNIAKTIGKKCEDEKVVGETNGTLIQKQILPSVKTEKSHTNESHESIPKTDNGIFIEQIESHMIQMKNDDNGNNEGSKSVPGSESSMHGELTSVDNSKAEKSSNCSAQKSIENGKTQTDCATKIQSFWRGFLVRKYVKQLRKQMENKRNGGTHITDEGNFPKDEPQRPASIDSNDSSNTVIFNDVHKKLEESVKTHGDHLLVYALNHRDFDDVDATLDKIMEYPLIKDEHLIDDYQNELLDRISGKQKESGDDPDKIEGTASSKRIEEIQAEDTLHTSLLLNNIKQDRTESQIEQIHPRSKLESVIEESSSPTADDVIDLKTEQADGMTTTTTSEKEEVGAGTEKNELSFCLEPSAPSCKPKVIEGKPLSDYVEEIEPKQKSLSSQENSTIGHSEKDDYVIDHTQSDVEPAGKIYSENFIPNHVVQHTVQENADKKFGSASAANAQSSDLENVKLLHSGEWHDSIIVPLPKVVTESLKNDIQKGRIGHFQESEASEKSLDSTADLSSILSNASAGLLHTGEMHDGIVVPISLSSFQRTISSGGENDGIDTVDSHKQTVQNPGVQTCNDHTNDASSVAVRVLQAPEPEVLTSPKPITAAGDVTRSDEGRTAQTPNKEDLRIQSEVSPSDSHSMESEGAGKTEEKNMEAQAATKIQAGFRGYQVRKQLKLKNGSSDMNSPKRQCRGKGPGRSDSAKSQTNRPKDVEEKSAVKIQAGVRGFLVRRRQKKQSNQES